jgi:hypothetical protein
VVPQDIAAMSKERATVAGAKENALVRFVTIGFAGGSAFQKFEFDGNRTVCGRCVV